MVAIIGHIRGNLSHFDDIDDFDGLSRGDKLICLGFGLTSSIATAHETEALDELEKRPFEILIVAGPEEDLRKFPLKAYYGNQVYQLRKNIFALIDGNRYEIEGKSYFVFGGGGSFSALPGIGTYLSAFSTLFASARFDYILSVSAPSIVAKKAIAHPISTKSDLPAFLNWLYLEPHVTFHRWLVGGFRTDCTWNDVAFLYKSMHVIIPPNEEVQ